MDGTPKLDRERYLQEMQAQVEAVLTKVADAVNNAAPGRVITDSEEPARDAFAQFWEAANGRRYSAIWSSWPTAGNWAAAPPKAAAAL